MNKQLIQDVIKAGNEAIDIWNRITKAGVKNDD